MFSLRSMQLRERSDWIGFYGAPVDELKSFTRCGDVNAVTQTINLITHSCDDFSPRLTRLIRFQSVELIHQRIADFKADYRVWLFHRTTNCRAAVLAATVGIDLFVALNDFDFQSPVVGNLFRHGVENIADLRIGRGKVALVYFGELPEPFAYSTAANQRLTGTKASQIGFELLLHSQKTSLWNVKRRSYRHPLPSLAHRLR